MNEPHANLYPQGLQQRMDGRVIMERMERFEAEVRKPSPKHVWTFVTQYRLSEEQAAKSRDGELGLLDLENLVMAAGPMCFRCESAYTTEPCSGYRDRTGTLV